MMNTKTNDLVQIWVEIADQSGRTHLEAHWVTAAHVPAHASAA